MKILWVKADFLHPTTKGGQIRTLETLKRLHTRHEIHYVAFSHSVDGEGYTRAGEYCTQAYAINHHAPPRRSIGFALQLLQGVFSPLPVAISRYRSRAMRSQIDLLRRQHRFDSVVCDFLAVAPNFPDLENCVLFQHNVETAIWRRHAEHAADPLRRAYLRLQEKRMFAYERRVCRSVAGVLAVSEEDAAAMRSMFGIDHVMAIPTGVDIEYFAPAPSSAPAADLTFIGSMDWLPNIDGMKYFVNEVLPLLRQRRPNCSLAIVGRDPDPEIVALARRDPLVRVTGTVADIRPHLWNAAVSIVPLRIGGGTRLKIYESMAARVPVVSTEVGAEGLQVRHGENIRLAATAEQFASECLDLLDNETERRRQSEAAFRLVDAHFSWDRVVPRFEAALERFCGSAAATCA